MQQHLDLHGCYGSDNDAVEDWNRNVWHIPDIVPPKLVNELHNMVLEVDPAYM